MTSFYSPCKCGKFYPRLGGVSVQGAGELWRKWRYIVICKHCGRHEPRKEK